MKNFLLCYLLPALLVLGCDSNNTPSKNKQLANIIDEHWQQTLTENPTFATSLGERAYDTELNDNTAQAYQKSAVKTKKLLERLSAINKTGLTTDELLNYDILKLAFENKIAESKHNGHFLVITNRSGPHLYLTNLVNRLPFKTAKDYQSYLARLQKMPIYMDKAIARIKQGLDLGWSHACAPLRGYEKSIATHIVADYRQSVFFKPLTNTPKTVELSPQFLDMAKIAITKTIAAFDNFHKFFTTEYATACTKSVGVFRLPGGKAYYDFLVKKYTTTNYTAKDVHDIGKSEVARIKAEMLKVKNQANFDGSFAQFQHFLRTDPKFYPKTAAERMQVVATISKKMDGLLPELFTVFPRMPYGIKAIPLDIAEKTTTAYYQRPSGDGTKAGFYYVNTTKLNTRPLYELEALSLHEAVPGHHFQIALAQELALPNFRKYSGFTAFVEGWGLYSERLGLEVGFYATPYTNFGRLSYEMWRACRLVVDSGMHYFGWSRQQAIDYMLDNSVLSKNNITTEVDRYITWPGQALAYKIGELKIRELRAYAEKELGNSFDKRKFHDKVLENGAVPLFVLETQIKNWVASQKS